MKLPLSATAMSAALETWRGPICTAAVIGDRLNRQRDSRNSTNALRPAQMGEVIIVFKEGGLLNHEHVQQPCRFIERAVGDVAEAVDGSMDLAAAGAEGAELPG